MKSLFNFILRNLHVIILLHTAVNLYFDFEENQEKINTAESNRRAAINTKKNLKRSIEKTKEFKQHLEEAKRRIEVVATQIEDVQRQLPSNISDAAILDLFTKETKLMNIRNVFLRPQSEKKEEFYFRKSYEVKGLGTFLQFLIFFERVSKSERLFNIKEVNITPTEKKHKGRFQLVNFETIIETFRYDPNHREDRGIEAIENQFTLNTVLKNKRKK